MTEKRLLLCTRAVLYFSLTGRVQSPVYHLTLPRGSPTVDAHKHTHCNPVRGRSLRKGFTSFTVCKQIEKASKTSQIMIIETKTKRNKIEFLEV